MMNKSKIEWTDFTWNPVTGCLHGCEYCYARKQARRFSGDVRLNKGSEQLQKDENGLYILENAFKNPATGRVTPHPVGFEPVMHRYRLPMPAQKKKPAKIFVCSMADLFGEWVPDSWIKAVLGACNKAPQHAYLFLTKNPDRYYQLGEGDGAIIPEEGACGWFGASAATEKQGQSAWENLNCTWMSIEPLHEDFSEEFFTYDDRYTQQVRRRWGWIVVGAETGNRKEKVLPKREWIQDIVSACREAGTPVFLKDSLRDIWGEDLIQEWPEGMPMDKGNDVPHCKECEHSKATQQGRRGTRYDCDLTDKHIPGRYSRTSPPWCPLRRDGDRS